MYVIVVAAGGCGAFGSATYLGPGGGGGGAGALTMGYQANTVYNLVTAGMPLNQQAGNSSSFKNLSGFGVTSTGGGVGLRSSTVRAAQGSSTNTLTGVTFVSTSGGTGGIEGNYNGADSSGILITIGATSYRYGGGGKAGTVTTTAGGRAGVDGIGATANFSQRYGESATTPGSGGGGGCKNAQNNTGSFGARGTIIITFTTI